MLDVIIVVFLKKIIGELPPYFMARAHRISGYDPDEEEDNKTLAVLKDFLGWLRDRRGGKSGGSIRSFR